MESLNVYKFWLCLVMFVGLAHGLMNYIQGSYKEMSSILADQ
jgi:hypothetical protein